MWVKNKEYIVCCFFALIICFSTIIKKTKCRIEKIIPLIYDLRFCPSLKGSFKVFSICDFGFTILDLRFLKLSMPLHTSTTLSEQVGKLTINHLSLTINNKKPPIWLRQHILTLKYVAKKSRDEERSEFVHLK